VGGLTFSNGVLASRSNKKAEKVSRRARELLAVTALTRLAMPRAALDSSAGLHSIKEKSTLC
jgi:biotin synthase-like enzyme